MPIFIKKSDGNWSTNAKKVFVKWSDGLWKSATRVLAKTASGWVQMWPGDAPGPNPDDPINIRLNSYSGTVAGSPQYINTVLYGHDSNGGSVIGAQPITITNRKMQVATDNTGQTDRYQVESVDIYDLTSNTETNVAEKRFYADGWWLFYQLDATNVWATTRLYSANPIKIIKQQPTFSTNSPTLSEDYSSVYPFFSLNFSFSDTWWKSADLSRSYIKWWLNTSKSPGGTALQTTYIENIFGLSTTRSGGSYEEYDGQGTTVSGVDSYTYLNASGIPAGQYIIAEIVLINSYTDHYNSPVSVYKTTGDKAVITSLTVTDDNGNGVVDNQSTPRIMSDGYLNFTATVSGASASTYYLLEPRFYNWVNGNYYDWNSTTVIGSTSFPTDITPTTTSFDPATNTATVLWRTYINADTLYGMGIPTRSTSTTSSRWQLEFRVSARATSATPNAQSAYFSGIASLGGDSIYLGGIDLPGSIDIAPSSAMTLNVSSTTAQVNNPVTFNISTASYPSGYASYPRRYYIDYGDNTNSGWISFSTGTSNPSVASISKTYTSTGTYTATLKWEPQGDPGRSTRSRTISVNPALSAPTSVSIASVSRVTDSSVNVSLNFSGGSGPYYQMYWTTASTAPTTAAYDAAATASPINDTFLPSANYTYYFYVRSSTENLGSTTLNGSSAVGTYSPYSNFSPNPSYYFTAPSGGTASISGNSSYGSTLTLTTSSPSASPSADGLTIIWRRADGGTGGNTFTGGTILQNGGYTYTTTSSSQGYAVRAEVTWNNGVGSQSANSNSIVVTAPVQAPTNASIPTLSPTSLSVGTQLSAGIGTWNNSPTSYDIRIYRGTAGVITSETLVASRSGSSTANLTYTITQADYDSGQRYFRTYVDASNSGGSSGLIAGQERGPIAAPVSIPSGGSVFLSGNNTAGSTITASTSGWSGSPTSYDVYITTALSPNTPTSSSTRVASSGGSSSTSYTITSSDAISPVNIFRAFATASNSAGTSGTVQSSTVITTQQSGGGGGGGSAPALSSISGNNSLALGGTFSWSFTNSPTSYSVFCQGPTGSVFTTSNQYTYSGTTFRPGYDGSGWQGAGNYTIYVSARNAYGDSAVASQTTYMS